MHERCYNILASSGLGFSITLYLMLRKKLPLFWVHAQNTVVDGTNLALHTLADSTSPNQLNIVSISC